MNVWLEDHIKCCGHPVRNFEPPYSKEQLETMKVPCAELRLLYALVSRFDIEIDYRIYDKFLKFANLRI